MKIFVLGGYGKTGSDITKMLAESDLVTQIAIGGRNLERAEQTSAKIGDKAVAVQAEGTDEGELTSLLVGYDLIVNAATNDAVIPSLRAAIRNKAHYCDMAWAGILEKAAELEPEARAAGITAILATGISPCISNLMCVHAARQLDEVKQFQIGRVELIDFAKGIDPTPNLWRKDPKDILTTLQDYRSFIGFNLNRLQNNGSRMPLEPKDNHWVEVDPFVDGLNVPLAQGSIAIAYPYFSGDDAWGMAPTDLAEEKSVEMETVGKSV